MRRSGMSVIVSTCVALLCGCADQAAGPVPVPRADMGGLRVIYPNGGEAFRAGDSVTIRFDCVDPAIVSPKSELDIVVELVRNDEIVSRISPVSQSVWDGELGWVIPAQVTGDSLRVSIYDYQGFYEKSDKSDGVFTIQ